MRRTVKRMKFGNENFQIIIYFSGNNFSFMREERGGTMPSFDSIYLSHKGICDHIHFSPYWNNGNRGVNLLTKQLGFFQSYLNGKNFKREFSRKCFARGMKKTAVSQFLFEIEGIILKYLELKEEI